MRGFRWTLTIGLLVALSGGPGWAQNIPVVPQVPQTGNGPVDAAGGVVNQEIQQVNNAAQNLPGTAKSAANHVVPGSGDAAETIYNIATSANPLGALVSSVLGGLESKLLEVVLEHGKLKERVTTLEADNTKRAIDVQHSKALIDQQAAQIVALTQQQAAMQAELVAVLATMEQQTQTLQARITELERTKGTITVPFKVIDTSGYPLVLIDEAAASFSSPDGSAKTNISLKPGLPAQLYLGNMAGGVSLEGGETNRMTIVSGETAVFELKQDAGQGIMMTGTTAEGSFELGSGPQLVGLMVKKDDQPAAGLGTFEGRGIALRMFAAGAGVVAAMGENPSTPGTGIAYVGNGTQNAAALAAMPDGSGIVHAMAVDGSVGSGLIGVDRMVAAYNAAGNAVVTIGKSENSEGGNVTARDGTGEGVFRAGYNSVESGGDACVYRAKKQNTYCLGIGAPMMGVGMF